MDVEASTPEDTPLSSTEDTPNTAPNMDKPTEKKSLSFMLAYGSVMASAFISTMDTVIVATALPAIAHDLRARSNQAYWLGSGFLFAQAVSQPLYGTLSGVFGRKACFLFAMILFTVASVFCATAQNIEWLIVARVVSNFLC
jgi:MFS family permease